MVRRKTIWVDNIFNDTAASGTTSEFALLSPQIDAWEATKGMTLLRTIVSLDVGPSALGVTVGVQRVSIGIGVAGEEAVTAGGAALPSPSNQADKPPSGWLYRQVRRIDDHTSDDIHAVIHIEAIVKGARKLMYGETFMCVQNEAVSGSAFTIRTIGLVRQLYALA